MNTNDVVDMLGTGIEFAGVVVLVLGVILAFVVSARDLLRGKETSVAYQDLRKNLGKGILIGLELLVAADIIRSVAVPTFEKVGVLGIIVIIRTFLSWSLELEVNGRWPWQGEPSAKEGGADHVEM